MSNEKQHSEQHQELLKKQSLEQKEVQEVLNFFKKYAMPAAVVILAICAVFLVVRMRESSRVAKEGEADNLLLNAVCAEDYQTIVDEYGKTSSGPLALMSLAMTRYNEGNYDEAGKLYADFVERYKKDDMVPQAKLNIITCRECKGEYSEAHLLYGEFISEQPDSSLAPLALMGKARCLEAMGSEDQAKLVYEDLMVNYQGSKWANLAESRKKIIDSKIQ